MRARRFVAAIDSAARLKAKAAPTVPAPAPASAFLLLLLFTFSCTCERILDEPRKTFIQIRGTDTHRTIHISCFFRLCLESGGVRFTLRRSLAYFFVHTAHIRNCYTGIVRQILFVGEKKIVVVQLFTKLERFLHRLELCVRVSACVLREERETNDLLKMSDEVVSLASIFPLLFRIVAVLFYGQ